MAAKPFQVLPSSISLSNLEAAVRCALTNSWKDVPKVTNWKAVALSRLDAAGVKTEVAFQKNLQSASTNLIAQFKDCAK